MFRKNMEPRCAYCRKGSVLNDREVICVKKGVVPLESSCSSFRYDPMKRVPPRPAKLNTDHLREEDFLI